MKRHAHLWPRLLAWDNLLLAARKARRGKRHRPVVQRFEFAQEWNLLRVQRELHQGTYRPGPFTTHWIHRPKRRLISAAPYRDRVVHHALMNVLQPLLDRHFHPDSYACRPGKGTHAAVRRLQHLMRRYSHAHQCDVRKFFPSIDHQLLKAVFRRLLKDQRLLELMDQIVDSSNPQEPVQDWFAGDDLITPASRRRGLPIGNLTSQWFANWYLTDLDHWIARQPGVGHVRYCDDFIVLANDSGQLRQVRAGVVDLLTAKRLRLHEKFHPVVPVQTGLTFVGYRSWKSHCRLRKDNVRKLRRRIRWWHQGLARDQITPEVIERRLLSWMGHAGQANSTRLLHRLRKEWHHVGTAAA